MEHITIADIQYYTTKEIINSICKKCGFDKVKYQNENISGRIRKGYYKATFIHSFNCFAEKLRASRKVKQELDKLTVV